ncbi:hydrogenase maturation nickel metallochaperone HypA [Rubrivirga sp.]|uniref:hydrogenase maturation nickel metallochaperone HypA n=1 Tax=Rubrivirga sp. TaxID=1885344 RepID=UPI003C781EB9
MHELSIATSLVSAADRAARDAGATRVTALHLRLGDLSGVVRGALDFAYEIAVEGTALEGSTLEVETVPVVVHCPTCDAERELPTITRFRCPVCDTPTGDVRAGREIEISHLEVESDGDLKVSSPTGDGAASPDPPTMPTPPWRR